MKHTNLFLLLAALQITTILATPLPSENIILSDFQLNPASSNDLTTLSTNNQPDLQLNNGLLGSSSSNGGTLSTFGGQGTISSTFGQSCNTKPKPSPADQLQDNWLKLTLSGGNQSPFFINTWSAGCRGTSIFGFTRRNSNSNKRWNLYQASAHARFRSWILLLFRNSPRDNMRRDEGHLHGDQKGRFDCSVWGSCL